MQTGDGATQSRRDSDRCARSLPPFSAFRRGPRMRLLAGLASAQLMPAGAKAHGAWSWELWKPGARYAGGFWLAGMDVPAADVAGGAVRCPPQPEAQRRRCVDHYPGWVHLRGMRKAAVHAWLEQPVPLLVAFLVLSVLAARGCRWVQNQPAGGAYSVG